MRSLSRCFAAVAFAAALHSQTTAVNDVGLTIGDPNTSVSVGQACGPVACTPLLGGTMAGGSTRTVLHHAAPNSPFVLAIGLPGPCLQIPGLANSLLLLPLPVTLTVGIVSSPSLTANCHQGTGRFSLTLPAGAPSGVVFRLQSIGVSNSGAVAFGPAIEAQTL